MSQHVLNVAPSAYSGIANKKDDDHRYFFERQHGFIGYPDALRFRGSVIPAVFGHVTVIALFSLAIVVAYLEYGYTQLAITGTVIPSLSVVLGLLLVFRTNSAYDRYWEGRKLWSTIQTQVRVMTRIIWLQLPETKLPNMTGPPVPREEKKMLIRMLIGCAISIKHRARKQKGCAYADYDGFIPPSVAEADLHGPSSSLTRVDMEIMYRITRYLDLLVNRCTIPYSTYASLAGGLVAFQDCLTNIDRIRGSPIPLAYLIHMKQTVTLYCCTLPFIMVKELGYLTPFFVSIVAFTLLGMDGIGAEIENPFGTDWNDLRLDYYTNAMVEETLYVTERNGGIPNDQASSVEEILG